MTEQQFLEKVSYSVNTLKEKLIVWYESKILAELDFSDNPERLYNDDYCTELAEQVALESSLADKIIKK